MSSPQSIKPKIPRRDAYRALRYRNFRYHMLGSFCGSIAIQMMSAAVSWDIYARTNSALALGFVGLVQALPVLLLSLPAGQIADELDRRRIVLFMSILLSLAWFGLYLTSSRDWNVNFFYVFLFINGTVNSLIRPARTALITQLMPLTDLPNAITWNGTRAQLSLMAGPALGGLGIAYFAGPAPVYLIAAAMMLGHFMFITTLRPRPQERAHERISWESISHGAKFVINNKLLLAPLTLDMLAVLFGGAVALMPIFAKDILHVGSTGYGFLLAAPGVGAITMLIIQAHMPPIRHAGKVLLWCVAAYGVAMIGFGLSKLFWFSMAMLFIAGGLDSVSVVIRHTLVQIVTPDYLRGRVSAVNGMFIGVSNQLGEFESGTVAKFIGPILTVLLGGIGTILVVSAVAFKWPQLRELDTLEEAAEEAMKKYGNTPENEVAAE